MSSPATRTTPERRGLRRWLVALVATILLVVSGSGLVAFAQSDAGTGKGPQFVPADAAVYVEARLDMPAGQDEALAQFMTAFPGFADAASFGLKVEEAANGLIGEATDGAISSIDVLSAFATGEAGLALMDLAAAAEAPSGGDLPMLVGVAISDRAAAEAFAGVMMGQMGADVTEETYEGASIIGVEGTTLGITDEWLLLSPTVELVKAGIDASQGTAPSLAEDPEFTAAFSRVPAAHLGAAYLDLASFGPLIEMAGASAVGQTGIALDTEGLLALLPVNMVAYLATEPDRMTLEAFITPGEATPSLPLGESDLSLLFPSDTQVYVETRELGDTLEGALGPLLAMLDEETAAGLAPIEDILGTPLPTLLDFVSDAGVGVGLSSDGLWLGIAAEVTDEEIASERLERILGVIRLIGAGMTDDTESGISVATETIGDAEVTVITAPLEEATGGALPFAIGDTISVSISDGTLLIGNGDFVANALTQAPADSLGESAGYTDALAGDTANSGVLYANVGSLLAVLDPMLGMMTPQWEGIAPYATALDRVIAVGTADDEVISVRMSVIVGP